MININFSPLINKMKKWLHEKYSVNKQINEPQSISKLWNREKASKVPFWISIVNHFNLPFEWAIDKTIELALARFKILQFIYLKQDREYLFELHNWVLNHTISRLSYNAIEGCQMNHPRLKNCLEMLEWTRQDITIRNANCLNQIKTLNPHLCSPTMSQPRPMWCVDPKVSRYLNMARNWAEKADYGLDLKEEYLFRKDLNYEQITELIMGLELMELQFKTKHLERACVIYINRLRRSRTLIKISFLAPGLLFSKAFETLLASFFAFNSHLLLGKCNKDLLASLKCN